jgi:hypothetical protein
LSGKSCKAPTKEAMFNLHRPRKVHHNRESIQNSQSIPIPKILLTFYNTTLFHEVQIHNSPCKHM